MSEFACKVVKVAIESHPNADAIEIAKVGDFQSIVRKGQFKTGDLAVYIPEQAILPDWLLESMGLMGKLSGSGKNRVRAVKLRGVLSQGLVYPVRSYSDTAVLVDSVPHEGNQGAGVVEIGGCAAECMGIKKYEPQLPQQMMGRIAGVDLSITHKYDFDNIKHTPSLFDGVHVQITEKIHGTLLCVGVVPERLENERLYKGRVFVTSKGMGGKGWILDTQATEGRGVHVEAAEKAGLLEKMFAIANEATNLDEPILLFGEVFGSNIQDLTYTKEGQSFRAFDMCIGVREKAQFLSVPLLREQLSRMGIDHVPVLYTGMFDKTVMEQLTNGMETVSGNALHIREGVVIKSTEENPHPKWGRRIAKSVSEAYLLRKNGTEFN